MCELLVVENRVFFSMQEGKVWYPWSSSAGLVTEASHGLTEWEKKKKKSQVFYFLIAEKVQSTYFPPFFPSGAVKYIQSEAKQEQNLRHHVGKVTC